MFPLDRRRERTLPAPSAAPPPDELRLPDVWRIVRRNLLLIVGCVAVAVAGALVYTARTDPLYEVSVLFGFRDEERWSPTERASRERDEIGTEMQIMGSRSLLEMVVERLGLQLVVQEPSRLPRDRIFSHVSVAEPAEGATFEFVRAADGRFTVRRSDGTVLGTPALGDTLRLGGMSVVLAPTAGEQPRFVVAVYPFASTVAYLRDQLGVGRPSADARLVRLRLRGPDGALLARSLNALAHEYIARRQEMHTKDARARAAFLKGQVATLAEQLAAAENQLRAFRERERVLDPRAEVTGQIDRRSTLRGQRGDLVTERRAIADLVAAVQASTGQRRVGVASPLRRISTHPALMKNEAIVELMRALGTVEQERATLLLRRTANDPEVMRLSERIADVESQLGAVVNSYQLALDGQISALDQAIAESERELAAVPRQEVEYDRLTRRPKVLESMYSLLQSQLKEAEVAAAAGDYAVQVVDSAVAPLYPVRPRPMLNLFAAVTLGLLGAAGAAGMREQLDSRLRTREAVQSLTSLPVLTVVPRLSRASSTMQGVGAALPNGGRAGLPAVAPSTGGLRALLGRQRPAIEARAVAEEAIGRLQTNLLFAHDGTATSRLVFTSPLPGDGKTTIVVNLALSLARHGHRVLLIDADLRRGSVHRALQIPSEPGLSSVLRKEVPLAGAITRLAVGPRGQALDVLPAGARADLPNALLSSPLLRRTLDQVEQVYDFVLIDSPPINLVADPIVLAASAQGVVLVVRAGTTARHAVEYALEQFRMVQAPLLGVVLNSMDMKRDAHYDHGYEYYAGSGSYSLVGGEPG